LIYYDFVLRHNILYLSGKLLSTNLLKQIKALYTQARSRLILLDYDGTLVGFQKRPEDAVPTPEVIQVLKDLTSDPANHVVINSGRDHQTLEKWLGGLPVSFAAEHGAYYKENGEWHQTSYKPEWSQSILSILNMFVHKTPKDKGDGFGLALPGGRFLVGRTEGTPVGSGIGFHLFATSSANLAGKQGGRNQTV